jgi:hypothetical protein
VLLDREPTYKTIYVRIMAVDQAKGTMAVTVDMLKINAKL